ncbi:hypothetical protein PAXRUDRAFT_832145 [Paxillus rubicundulus Ve08.2h10]|uniref:Uncharacterized protein n=1 Tax=Paxillus rubicundulus Ve08.2h10 TaxID=930991 RepID=A0A0D0DS90_9AGAM|nr:hypothetical protein PAXRUDRAFT_832145 [Paxillus rubicundulus Ve08.2h10]
MSSQSSSGSTFDGAKLGRRPAAWVLDVLDGPAWEVDDGPALDAEPDCSGCDEEPSGA